MKVVAVGLLMMGAGLFADKAAAGAFGAPSYIEHDFSDIDLDIPDGDTRGLTEMFRIDQRGSITYMLLELQIEHTWIGDLTVTLISPSGTETILHDRTGSSR